MAGCCLGSGSLLGTLGTVRGCTPGTVFNNSPIRDTSEYSPPQAGTPEYLIWGVYGGTPLLVRDLNTDFGPKPRFLRYTPGSWGGYRNPDSGAPGGPPLPGPRDPRGALGSSGGPSKSTPSVPRWGPQNHRFRSVFENPRSVSQTSPIVARLRGGVKPTPSPLCLCNIRR